MALGLNHAGPMNRHQPVFPQDGNLQPAPALEPQVYNQPSSMPVRFESILGDSNSDTRTGFAPPAYYTRTLSQHASHYIGTGSYGSMPTSAPFQHRSGASSLSNSRGTCSTHSSSETASSLHSTSSDRMISFEWNPSNHHASSASGGHTLPLPYRPITADAKRRTSSRAQQHALDRHKAKEDKQEDHKNKEMARRNESNVLYSDIRDSLPQEVIEIVTGESRSSLFPDSTYASDADGSHKARVGTSRTNNKLLAKNAILMSVRVYLRFLAARGHPTQDLSPDDRQLVVRLTYEEELHLEKARKQSVKCKVQERHGNARTLPLRRHKQLESKQTRRVLAEASAKL